MFTAIGGGGIKRIYSIQMTATDKRKKYRTVSKYRPH